MQKRVGFAGLGLMGSRMAANLLKKGFPLTVWNRTAGKGRTPWPRTGRAWPRPRSSWPSTRTSWWPAWPTRRRWRSSSSDRQGLIGAVRPGFRYLECSTVAPETTKRVAAALRERGGDLLEAPMTGSKNGAAQGTLLFMTGGSPEVHEELLPVILAMGSKAILCGDVGAGSTVKLIGNTLISFMLEGPLRGARGRPQGRHSGPRSSSRSSRPRASPRPTTPSRGRRS